MMIKTQLPDGPPAPRWLQKIQYMKDSIGYLESAGQRYGDIFATSVYGNHGVELVISNPQAIQQILMGDTKQFMAPPHQLLQPIVGDHSIFLLTGERHRQERRLLMPPFHGDRMRTYGSLICELVDKAMVTRSIEYTPFSVHQLAQEISLAVILKVVFGIDQEEQFNRFKSVMLHFAKATKSPFIAGFLYFPSLKIDWGTRSPWGYFRHLQRQMSELIYNQIADRRQQNQGAKSDILSLLIAATDETGQPMSDAELHDELITMVIAGSETTASAIAWAMYWIHRHPRVREKLLAELNALGSSPDPTTVAQLPYLTAVCQETLRLSPIGVVTVPRAVKEPVELMGYQLQPGIRLYGCIYLLHQRPDLYPEPKSFKPERFLERQFSPFEFMPFGGGARRCIGEALALFEMKLVVATLLSHYPLVLADQVPEQPRRQGVIFVPARGVQMTLSS
jgi:cytochrome P450 family 110